MYLDPEDLKYDILYQGDVLKNFPFFIFQNNLSGLKQSSASREIFQLKEKEIFKDGEAILVVKSKLSHIIILSQTCDIQDRTHVIVAPIYSIKNFEDEGILKDGKVGLIKERKINYWFYLPKLEGILEDSFADFQTIYYVPREMLESYKKNKILALSDWGRHHLGWALSNYFCRPIKDKNS